MAKDKSEDPEIISKKEKKEKKEKKRKHDEVEEVEASSAVKKERKEKKRKSGAADGEVTAGTTETKREDHEDGGDDDDDKKKVPIPLAALVPFANPLCDDKNLRKVLKSVKKAAKHKALKRGVKEVVKSLRKSAPTTAASPTALPSGIVVLAADISPMDVISHIPVLCEDHHVPYVYVPSRAELGAAGSTKRPTSVVLVAPRGARRKEAAEGDAEDAAEWESAFAELHKLALKMGQTVRV